MKPKAEILYLLSQYKSTAVSKYGLTRIGMFGSVARGEQTDDSDVDVCYEGLDKQTRGELLPQYPEIYWCDAYAR